MSNQFYNYLKDKLVEFLCSQHLKGGERFYVQFDEDLQVEEFYDALNNSSKVSEFTYQHQKGSVYNTFEIKINGVSVVIAATVNNITSDFLVTLRNEVETQKNQWENKAIVFLFNDNLDSIKDGSSNLLKEGMPFHVKTITKNLNEEINNSSLNKAEKKVAQFYLELKLSDRIMQPTLWEFEEVLSLISQGSIKEEEYSELGLFYDGNLLDYKSNEISSRLKENHTLYSEVERIHDFGNKDENLEKIFDEKGVNKLKGDKWKEQEYTFVKESYENNKSGKVLEYIESVKKVTENGLVYWERPYSITKAGSRKRHIIIFNPMGIEEIEMNFSFDDYVKKEFLNKSSLKVCKASGKRLKVKLNHKKGQPTFEKITYTHNKKTNSKYEFNIAIIEAVPEILSDIKTNMEVASGKKRIIINNNDEALSFGVSEKVMAVDNLEDCIVLEMNSLKESINLPSSVLASIENEICVDFKIDGSTVPLLIKNKLCNVSTITSKRVWKLKREHKENFIINNNRLVQSTREFYPNDDLKKIISYEEKWIDEEIFYGQIHNDELIKISLDIDTNLKNSYMDLINYYKSNKIIPTLAYIDDKLRDLFEKYIFAFNTCLEKINDNNDLKQQEKNLSKLATIIKDDKIILMPLHPLNIAYQLALYSEIDEEILEFHILNRLNTANLLPYIYGQNDKLLRSISQNDISEWLVYEPINKVTSYDTNSFLANIIEEKLKQFMKYFNYLFIEGAKAPLKVNMVNIGHKKEVIKGIFNFIKKQMKDKGPDDIVPVEIALYQHDKNQESIFEYFSRFTDIDEISQEFDLDFKLDSIPPIDVLRIFQDNIYYFKFKNTGEYKYTHITFCDMVSQDENAKNQMDKIETGVALNGLLSTTSSFNCGDDYRSGFGIKNILDDRNLLLNTAKNLNELMANVDNRGNNSYRKNQTIVTITSTLKENMMKEIYESSYWVTFINPRVDLEFFQKNYNNLLIIHYNDQYTSSNYYDAITVTNKLRQFVNVVKEYLDGFVSNNDDEKIYAAIKAFNSINGEWLLRMIGSKGQFSREKLSIVSAIKYTMGYLEHKNIIWIPISLEEILRVAGAVRLDRSSGIFSAKNIKIKGNVCDDLLFIGLEVKEDASVCLHYYPVEVKVGFNQGSVIEKAKKQINKIRETINEQLLDKDDEKRFVKKFFRNFFVQIFLLNAKKFEINDIWPEKSLDKIEEVKNKLLNDEYGINNNLTSYIGKGAVLSFRKDNPWRAAKIEDDILVIDLTEEDAYKGAVENLEDIKNKIQKGRTDLKVDRLLSRNYKNNMATDELEKINELNKLDQTNEDSNDIKADSKSSIEKNDKAEEEILEYVYVKNELVSNIHDENETSNNKLEDIRILLGTIEGSTKEVYWEYGHKSLPNRHILISGKSGQGKSYFIQCLLMELSQVEISSIIVDYTDGFKKSQLEPEFKEVLGDKIKQFLVIKDKFPLDPFKINKKEIDEGIYIDEDYADVAERVKSILAAIYKDLGSQQLNCIYQATKRGLERYEGRMNLSVLKQELEEDSSGPAKTVLAQLALLFDKDPFDYNNNYNWSELDDDKGIVNIIQLTGFKREIQLIITEFILWDLWYYKLHHGNKDIPLPVILDEAQNLDHSGKSPSAKILTEGRKFGWSGWYATQFLRGQLNNDEIKRLENSSQMAYFLPPDSEIGPVATNLSRDSSEKKVWERKLSSLKKGQCISQGLFIDDNGENKGDVAVVVDITPIGKRVERLKR